MKAVGVVQFGGPEVLMVLDLPEPQAGPGQVRIRVRAAAVNPVDALIRRGLAFVADAAPPYVPGMDAAGVIDQIGEPTSNRPALRIGDRVLAVVVVSGTRGAYAEQVVVPAESVVAIPAGLTDVAAATLPMNGLTAQMALDLLDLPAGATVAVTGAAGAVGGYAVSLAHAAGLRVFADAGPGDVALVESLGADLVLARGPQFAELVRRAAPQGVDGLVDTAGIVIATAGAVRDGGRIATSVGGTATTIERGIVSANTFVPLYAREHAKLEHLRELASNGLLLPRVAQTMPLDQATQAHQRLESGGLRGRLVLIP